MSAWRATGLGPAGDAGDWISDAIILRPCQVAAYRGQIELGEIMVRTRASDAFSYGYRRYNPCWIKRTGEDGLGPSSRSGPQAAGCAAPTR